MSLLLLALAAAGVPPESQARGFDPQIGRWHTQLRRLAHPLSAAPPEWISYSGTTNVTPIWGGTGNLVELEVDGGGGHIEGLSVRLFDPQARQWRIYYSNSRFGTLMGQPVFGAFTDGRGEFYGSDSLDGRAILVRFVIAPENRDTVHFEQSYSADGGKTWEANWIATDTRLP